MPLRSSIRRPGLLAIATLAVVIPVHEVQAQRRIEGQRYGGGPLYQNPAGRALGSGAVNTPNGVLGDNALGYGDALDGNLQVGSGGRNFRRPSGYGYAAVQARNLVVTNGVAGGRGFRGNVDYAAPGDFAAPTADDDLYRWRRDSALSGLDFVTSPQQRDAFNIAQGVGVFQYRRDFTTLPQVNSVDAARRIDDAEIRLDRAATTLRTGNLLDTAVVPADIGLIQTADNQAARRVTASPIRGIQYTSVNSRTLEETYEEALANDTLLQLMDITRMGHTPQPFDEAAAIAEPEPATPENRIESPATGESAYADIVRRIYENYEGRDDVVVDTAGLERMRGELGQLDARIAATRIGTAEDVRPENVSERRAGLPGDRRPDAGIEVGPASDDTLLPGLQPEDPLSPTGSGSATDATDDGKADDGTKDGTKDGTEEEENGPRSLEELIDALAHRSEVSELVDPRMRARVAQVVGQAEQAMRERDYFRAEDRFDLALRLNPGNPLLEAGRANAQIGAGLYRSAAVTLIGLFRKHASMIDVGYDADLLPSSTRLRLAEQSISEIIAKDPEGSSGLGVVVAYIGRQLGDRAMIEKGLDAIDDPRVNSLVPKLRAVWLTSKPLSSSISEAG